MNELNLRALRELLPFKELFAASNDYMREASFLPHIELASTPLYELVVEQRVLFSPKLRYYRLLVENEINRHLNQAISHTDKYVIHYILKLTREAVETLIHEANEELLWLDADEAIWHNLSSDSPDFRQTAIANKEYIVFLHLVIAELVRCWMELQDSYADWIGAASRYDVPLCYTTFACKMPDKIFEVRQTEPATKKGKKDTYRTDCCFLYDNKEFFNEAIQEFTNLLHRYKQIPESIDYKMMSNLFSGKPCKYTYQWLGSKAELTSIIKKLCPDQVGNPTITTWPSQTPKWYVVAQRFVDENENPMNGIERYKEGKTEKTMIKEITDAFIKNLPQKQRSITK